MSQDTQQQDHISKKTVLYQVPGIDAVTVRRDVQYAVVDSDVLTMDVYYPPDNARAARLPAMVIVGGFPDAGVQKFMGCPFKEIGSSTSWGRLIAASGMVAVTYTNREPTRDIQSLFQHLRQHAAALGIDENRLGVWASSGSVPLALWTLMQAAKEYLKCAVLCYGFTMDVDGFTGVAEAARTWGFANPAAGKSVDDLGAGIALFIVRAGQDQFPHLNASLERFLAQTVARNLPVTFINHPTGPHSFDLLDDSETTREIIRQSLAFMRFNLGGGGPSPVGDVL